MKKSTLVNTLIAISVSITIAQAADLRGGDGPSNQRLKEVESPSLAWSVMRMESESGIPRDAVCVVKIDESHCGSDGYLSGENVASCSQNVTFKIKDGSLVQRAFMGLDVIRTNTGLLGVITLGLSDAIANQANALNARSNARKNLDAQINDVNKLPSCDGSLSGSGDSRYATGASKAEEAASSNESAADTERGSDAGSAR